MPVRAESTRRGGAGTGASITANQYSQLGELPYAIRLFDHHGMLGFGRFRWRPAAGGSREYVEAIGKRLGGAVRLGSSVRGIRRDAEGVELRIGDEVRRFDEVVVATHADEALTLLEDPSDEERRALGGFAYTINETVLHTDSSFLPRAPAARASRNYRTGDDGRPTLTYYLNRLQVRRPPHPLGGSASRQRLPRTGCSTSTSCPSSSAVSARSRSTGEGS